MSNLSAIYGTSLPVRDEQWADAPCVKHEDPDLYWFVDEYVADTEKVRTEIAKSLCRICPVLDLCRVEAFDADPDYGVYAGMTTRERRAIQARKKRALGPQTGVRPGRAS